MCRQHPSRRRKRNFIETVLFARPALYRVKRFLVEVVLWRLLAGIFRLQLNPMPDITTLFAGRRVLMAACGPGNALTGPPIRNAAQVTAFDISQQFAASCATRRPDWTVYCGDLLTLPHRDHQFDVSVLYSTLHHLPASAADALRELVRVTSERIVLVEGVIPGTGLLRTALLLWYRLVDGGYHYYTLAEIESFFADLGLEAESKNLYSPIKHMLLAVLDCRRQQTTPVPRPALDHTAHAPPKH